MAVQDGDKFIVNRGGTDYKVSASGIDDKLQDDDQVLINRGGTDYKVSGADLRKYLGIEKVIRFHIINLQNVTGSSDPLEVKTGPTSRETAIIENLTTGDEDVVHGNNPIYLTEGNEYLITLDSGQIYFGSNDAYNWDFGPRCYTKLLKSLKNFAYKNTEFDGDVSNLDVSNVTDMHNSFCGDGYHIMKFSAKGVEKWDVSNVVSFYNSFCNNKGLTDLEAFKDWDVSKVTAFATMFNNCNSLTSAKAIEGWNTKSATDMAYMFQTCNSVTEVSDFSGWCVTNVSRYPYFNGGNKNIIEPVWGTCPRGEDQ